MGTLTSRFEVRLSEHRVIKKRSSDLVEAVLEEICFV